MTQQISNTDGAPPPLTGRSDRKASAVSAGSDAHGEPVLTPRAPPPLAGEGGEGASPGTPEWRVKSKTRQRARALRQDLTKAERIVWYGLRAHRLEGAGFRRQTPMGPYIVDFVSHTAKLVIEIDGGQHFENGQEARDRRRGAFLAGKGFRVLRFSNHDVMTNRIGVLEVIAEAVREAKAKAPSLPSPASGGGRESVASGTKDQTAPGRPIKPKSQKAARTGGAPK